MADRLEAVVGRLLGARNLTLATAESCTGGLIAHLLTNVPGSSNYFLGGLVVYTARLKEQLAGVQSETIRRHTVYSGEVALELAQGARRVIGSDIGVGVTGIAGPDGGTFEQPVGLVYIALSADDFHRVERFQFGRDRIGNKEEAAEQALRMIVEQLFDRP
jgi:PncC family amidohydrolase